MEYKSTLNLPKTDFPMKANLPQKEPEILKKWQEQDIYYFIRASLKDKPRYVLHDGPPYANGRIHIGHSLNKILKDIIVKFKTMKGYYAPYQPGWDCHGMPIEHQLFKELGKTKAEIPQIEFRKKAAEYARKYVEIQKEDFKRLGVFADWDASYLTMDSKYEAAALEVFVELFKKGLIYSGLKPIHWCRVCETALAEAEVEYAEHTSPSVYVRFGIRGSGFGIRDSGSGVRGLPSDIHLIVWTTTPWTLTANMRVAAHPHMEYSLVRGSGFGVRGGEDEVLVIAKKLVPSVMEKIGCSDYKLVGTVKGEELKGLRYKHPFMNYESEVITDDFVSEEDGTGLVHIAPSHGQEDYAVGLRNGISEFPELVDTKGRFYKEIDCEDSKAILDKQVFKANPIIIEWMEKKGTLLYKEDIAHSYPHCWRCKAPLIFRAAQQWFMRVDEDFKEKLLKVIEGVEWFPKAGMARMKEMISQRPDWCLSRQRYWGVPIPLFRCAKCETVLEDGAVLDKVVEMVREDGTDAWFKKEPAEILGDGTACAKCGSKNFKKEHSILDVWFESGASYYAALERAGFSAPAELYLEGSDQHRGWFQASLLTSVGTTGRAPFKNVLTHGFVVDGEGKKMSKSTGNVISPQQIIKENGADILRLWVVSSDYNGDIRISKEILARIKDVYRKLRNTCKFLLGNLYDFSPEKDAVEYDELLEIDRWALGRLGALIETAEKAYEEFEFFRVYHSLYNFCVVDMSSFYLDILKDRMYTDKADSKSRRSGQTVFYEILSALTRIFAPILSFTAEEVWGYSQKETIFLAEWPEADKRWKDSALGERWEGLIQVRERVLKALEEKRTAGVIGNSLQAEVSLEIGDEAQFELLNVYKEQLASIFIVSAVELHKGKNGELKVEIKKSQGAKCERCWIYSGTVGEDKAHTTLCSRCVGVVGKM